MRVTGILAILALMAALTCAGGRKKIWTLDLSQFVAQPELAELVWGVAFSPDESKIAIGFGPNLNLDPRPRRVIIVAIDEPKVVLSEFAVVGYRLPSGLSLEWSPSGDSVVVRSDPPVMFRMNGEPSCPFPDGWSFAGFLSRDRMVLSTAGSLKILNADCPESSHGEVSESARALATSSTQDLIAIGSSNHVDLLNSVFITQHRLSGDVDDYAGSVIFSVLSHRVCSALQLPNPKNPFAACWNTQTGEIAAQAPQLGVDRLAIQSAGGNLVALTQYKWTFHDGPIWVFFDMNGQHAVSRHHVLWNVETGQRFASWDELHQTELLGKTRENARAVRSPFVLSLSRTARYFAEGGSRTVTLYSIAP
jgi:hypothetical protein